MAIRDAGRGQVPHQPHDQNTNWGILFFHKGGETVAGHEPTVYPFPSSSSGSQSTIVDAADVRISWAGSFWILGPSSCNSTAQSKKTSSAGHSLAFEVTSAASVYLTLSARNVVYIITVDGRSSTYTETSALDDCKLTWSSGIINTRTSIDITVEGSATSPFDKRRQTSGDWSFEFHNFLMSIPGSSATANSIGPSISTVPGNAAACFKAQPALYKGLLTVFVVFFSLF
ncbi:hypothetical protein BDZ94DRAFT_1314228 [Collybia nuda]|uniref:Uncharacterized protein n=1 Tax=Collybia nuda TaxID=64659 RepID=A0A9P5XV73_9AGAR|nr:hypothetical protein BDZ94DRAFT_1314228 [Collybia nuda]